jgi:hypothetical protein
MNVSTQLLTKQRCHDADVSDPDSIGPVDLDSKSGTEFRAAKMGPQEGKI